MRLIDIFKKKQKGSNSPNSVNIPVSITTTMPSTLDELDDQVIPIDVRVKSAITDRYGLFPHELLVLDYAHTFYTNGNSFQGFWWYKYGIRDVQIILTSLMERGFLRVGDLQAALERQTAKAIKDILRAHGCKLTGKKADLIQRALKEISMDELNQQFPERTYQLTERGKVALDEGAYVSYIHRHGIEDLDIWSLNRLVYTSPYMSYRDKIWGYLNQRSMKHFSERNFGFYRNCRFEMSQFLKEEGKLKDALAMLAEVVFYDLSGVTNNYDSQFLEIYAGGFFPYENSLVTTAPGIIDAIVDCQEKLGYSDDELKMALAEHMNKLSTPLQLFSVKECARIVLMERDKDTEGLTKVYAKAKKAFKLKYPKIKI